MKSDIVKMAGSAVLGFLVLAAGLTMITVIQDPQGILLPLPYLLIGIGCGGLGYCGGELIKRKLVQRDPKLVRAIEIESRDERNQMVANKAKAKAYDLMIWVFGLLIFVFALMQVNTLLILILVAAYLFVVSSSVYYTYRFSKEM